MGNVASRYHWRDTSSNTVSTGILAEPLLLGGTLGFQLQCTTAVFGEIFDLLPFRWGGRSSDTAVGGLFGQRPFRGNALPDGVFWRNLSSKDTLSWTKNGGRLFGAIRGHLAYLAKAQIVGQRLFEVEHAMLCQAVFRPETRFRRKKMAGDYLVRYAVIVYLVRR